MTQCRRCENIGIKREGKSWYYRKPNEVWWVCEECYSDMKWADTRKRQFIEEWNEVFKNEKK